MSLDKKSFEVVSKLRESTHDFVSTSTHDFFQSFIDHKFPSRFEEISSSQKAQLSHDLLKHYEVQRILSDMGERLEEFIKSHFEENYALIERFLTKGTSLPPPKPLFMTGVTEQRRALYSAQGERSLAMEGRHTPISNNAGDKQSVVSQTLYPGISSPSPMTRKAPNKARLRTNSPTSRSGKRKTPAAMQNLAVAPIVENKDDVSKHKKQAYYFSDLGQNFMQTIGKTEKIRENISEIETELHQSILFQSRKLAVNNQDIEDLLATKHRVVKILEDIIEKEHTDPEELAEMIEENWDLTQEYEKAIADMTIEHQKEKDAIKQRYENRIFRLKENFIPELAELEGQRDKLKRDLKQMEEAHREQLKQKDADIEILSGKVTLLEAQILKMETKNGAPSQATKRSKGNSTIGTEKPKKEKARVPIKSKYMQMFAVKALKDGAKPKTAEEASSKDETPRQMLLDLRSEATKDRRDSRSSISSHDTSPQHSRSPSKALEDWEPDDRRDLKRLREFFVKLHEKVAGKKSQVGSDSNTSLDANSDDDSHPDDIGMEISEIVTKQMANPELCDAAGVKPFDAENGGGSIKKRFPGMLFQRRKKANLSVVEVIPEDQKEENKEEEESLALKMFASSRENLISFVEAIIKQKLPSKSVQTVPRLLREEVTLSLNRVLTIEDFADDPPNQSSEWVVTVEQLIINCLNLYLSLISSKPDILQHYHSGKMTSKKVFKSIALDTAGIPKPPVPPKINKEVQVTLLEDTKAFKGNDSINQNHMRDTNTSSLNILNDSFMDWKRPSSQSRGGHHVISSFEITSRPSTRTGQGSSSNPKDKPPTVKRILGNNANRRASSQIRSFYGQDIERDPARSPDYIPQQNDSMVNISNIFNDSHSGETKGAWRNLPMSDSKPESFFINYHKFLEPRSSLGNPQMYYPMHSSVPVQNILIPEKDRAVPKREEIRQKLLSEKRRFTSYIENGEGRGWMESDQYQSLQQQRPQAQDPVRSIPRPSMSTPIEKPKDYLGEMHDLSKRTVLALYDYIVNIQRQNTDPASLRAGLNDVNKKVAEIEDMLKISVADRRYSALISHIQEAQRSNPSEVVNASRIESFLHSKRHEVRQKAKQAVEAHSALRGDDLAPLQEDDDQTVTEGSLVTDEASGSQKKETEGVKKMSESTYNSGPGGALDVRSEEQRQPRRNIEEYSVSGSVARDGILISLSKANEGSATKNRDGSPRERAHRLPKKSPFKVRKNLGSKERIIDNINKSVI